MTQQEKRTHYVWNELKRMLICLFPCLFRRLFRFESWLLSACWFRTLPADSLLKEKLQLTKKEVKQHLLSYTVV